MIHSDLGLVHVIAAVAALLTGTWVLFDKKGTQTHIKVGYAYILAMSVMLATAFGIYHLWGKWGIFHYMAVVSSVTLALGMWPVLRKNRKPESIYYHFSWMYWSVIGLYAAFASEMLTRIPETPFFGMVGVATTVIMVVASIVFGVKKKKWRNEFLLLER